MTNAPNRLTSLLHPLGVSVPARPARVRACKGSGASKIGRSAILSVLATTLGTLAFTAAPALAAAPEAPETTAASEVGYTTASLSGVVNPGKEGEEGGEYQFFYGQNGTCAEGASVPGFAGKKKQEPAGPIPVSGLAPNTTYSFCLVERNGEGEAVSVEPYLTFTTKAVAAPTVTLNAISTFAGTTAHLSGTIDPNAPGAAPQDPAFNTTWSFSCTPECPGLTGGEVVADDEAHEVSVDATRLVPNTTYEVTLTATNLGGTVSAGPETFTTLTTEPIVEPATTSTEETAATTATVSTKINPGGEPTSYHAEYVTNAQFQESGWAKAKQVPAPPAPEGQLPASGVLEKVSEHLTGLTAETGYHVRFVAKNPEHADRRWCGSDVHDHGRGLPPRARCRITARMSSSRPRATLGNCTCHPCRMTKQKPAWLPRACCFRLLPVVNGSRMSGVRRFPRRKGTAVSVRVRVISGWRRGPRPGGSRKTSTSPAPWQKCSIRGSRAI